jgi:tetratricopeptide (TPR) repeat protein
MKKAFLLLVLLLVSALAGSGVYWQRTHSLAVELARARAMLGTLHAGRAITAAAERFPDSAELQFLCARQWGYEGSPGQAEVYLKRALLLGWPRQEVQRQRWLVGLHKDFNGVVNHLQALRDQNPNDQEVLVGLALGFSRLNLFGMAEALVELAIRNDPRDGAAYYVRGKIRLQRKVREQAIEDLDHALTLGPNRYFAPAALTMKIICLRQMGRYEEAYDLARRQRRDDPDNVLLLFNLGLCARHTDRPDEALEAFEAVLRLRPRDGDTRFQMAYIYDEKRQLDKALALLNELEAEYFDDPQLLVQKARTLAAMGDTAQANAYQTRFVEQERQRQQRAQQRSEDQRSLMPASVTAGLEERAGPPVRRDPIDK